MENDFVLAKHDNFSKGVRFRSKLTVQQSAIDRTTGRENAAIASTARMQAKMKTSVALGSAQLMKA